MTVQGVLRVIAVARKVPEVIVTSIEGIRKVLAGDVKGCPRPLAAQGASKVAESLRPHHRVYANNDWWPASCYRMVIIMC